MLTRKSLLVVLLLAVAASATYPLLAGMEWIEAVLPGGLPLGNALAAAGLCAMAAAAMALSPPATRLRTLCRAALFAAIAWLPLSLLLAGNLALNFNGGRGLAWMVATLAVVLCVLLALLAAAIRAAIDRLHHKRRLRI